MSVSSFAAPAAAAAAPAAGTSNRAVVMGGSMAGLLAARVLSARFDEVVVVERDELLATPVVRKGTPHAFHAHGLLSRGRLALEALFPGFGDAMLARGAVPLDLQSNARYFVRGEYFARGGANLKGLVASRPAIEAEVRARVSALPNVRVMARTEVVEPLYDAAERRVVGVRVRPATAEPTLFSGAKGTCTLDASLVIDATGRGSQTPKWLEQWGYAPPREERVTVAIGYVTAYYERQGHDLAVVACTGIPGRLRCAAALAQEPLADAVPRWVVTIGGYLGDHPEASADGMRRAAIETGCEELIDITHRARQLTKVGRYRFPHSQRRRYELLRQFPAGFVPIGDALASFNPIYGQGMSVAASEALLLHDALESTFADRCSGLAQRFLPEAARVIDNPWQIAVGADLAHPDVDGPRSFRTRVMNRYMARLQRAGYVDPVVASTFVAVTHLVAPPAALLAPGMLTRVLLRGSGRDRAVARAGLETAAHPVSDLAEPATPIVAPVAPAGSPAVTELAQAEEHLLRRRRVG